MKQRFYAMLLAVTVIGTIPITGTEAWAAEPYLSDTQVFRATGTVELVHTKQGSVVINDREYSLSSTLAKSAIRGARIEFSYREGKPLPVITEISTRR